MTEVSVETCFTDSKVLSLSLNSISMKKLVVMHRFVNMVAVI